MEREDAATIQISKEMGDRLREPRKMGETYDDVIRRLIKLAKQGSE